MVRKTIQERQQVDPNREGSAIVVTNFSGLNTTSNPMTIPYEDSPVFTNVIVGDFGGVERRQGTQVVFEPTSTNGSLLIPVSTGFGYNYVLTKDGTNIAILEVSDGTASVVITKQQVWSSSAADVEPTYATLPEPGATNVVLCTGVNAPVQVRFDEFRTPYTVSASTNNILVTDDARVRPHQVQNTLLYVNGVQRTVTAKGGAAGNTIYTISGSPLLPGDYVIDFVCVTWQWWAESFYYYGDRFYDTANRSHAKATDVHVAIPENLRDDMEPLLPSFPFLYPIDALYWNGTQQVYANAVSDLTPTTAYQYTFTDGSQRLNTNTPGVFSKNYVTFGTVDNAKSTTVESIYFLRRRKLKFRGGLNKILASSLHVSVDNIVKQQRAFGSSLHNTGDYLLYASNVSFTPLPIVPSLVDFISFGGGGNGVPPEAIVRITNKQPIYAGSNCVDFSSVYSDGAWVPCYGLGQFSDYSSFSFPRLVELVQQRLVFSGFPHAPLSVCMSSINDTNTPGEYFRFFQQDVFTSQPTDPIDFTVSSPQPDEYITSLVEHQGSLFVGATQATYRVSATGRAPLEPGNVYVSAIGATGPLNHRCVTKTETSVLLLCERGVFSLENGSNSQEATEYNLAELSVPIHSIFKSQPEHFSKVAWMSFNVPDNSVLVGLASNKSKTVATRLFRYGVFRDSWSEFTCTSGFNTFGGATVKAKNGDRSFLYVAARLLSSNGTPSALAFLQHTDKVYLDYSRSVTYTGSPLTLTITPVPTTTHIIVSGVRYYDIRFETIPINDVYDLQCTVGNTTLVPGVDFHKVGGQVFLQYGEPGETLVITYKNVSREDNAHFVVYVDNTPTELVNGTIAAPVGANLTYGTTYQSVFSTPLFTWGTLFGNKRVLYWAGLFDNRDALARWRVTDVNGSSGQSASSIVDLVKKRANCSVSFVYNSDDRNTSTSSDLYNFGDFLTYDVGSVFDVDRPMQSEPEVLVRQSLQGVGYSFRCVVWECSDAYFSLMSYQIDARSKGKMNRHWSE